MNHPVQKQKEPRDYSIGCHVSPKSRPVKSAPLLCFFSFVHNNNVFGTVFSSAIFSVTSATFATEP